jgi:hypothetical protein
MYSAYIIHASMIESFCRKPKKYKQHITFWKLGKILIIVASRQFFIFTHAMTKLINDDEITRIDGTQKSNISNI